MCDVVKSHNPGKSGDVWCGKESKSRKDSRCVIWLVIEVHSGRQSPADTAKEYAVSFVLRSLISSMVP